MKKVIAFMIATLIACAGVAFAGEPESGAQAGKVKGSKSNTSERVGEGGGEPASGGAQETTTVKGSKSNSDNRSTVKSSKSNSSE